MSLATDQFGLSLPLSLNMPIFLLFRRLASIGDDMSDNVEVDLRLRTLLLAKLLFSLLSQPLLLLLLLLATIFETED